MFGLSRKVWHDFAKLYTPWADQLRLA